MAGLEKLQRGARRRDEGPLWAVYAGQTDPPLGESAVVLPEVRFEPILLFYQWRSIGLEGWEADLRYDGN